MKVTLKLRPEEGPRRGFLAGVPGERRRLQPNPLATCVSVGLHIGAIALLAAVETIFPSQPTRQEATVNPLEHAKLVWYLTKDRLPEVAPNEQQRAGKPKVELRRPGQVIATDTQRPQGKQFIWQPAPKIEVERETPLPNVLALVPKPARPEPRKFVPTERLKAVAEPLSVLPEAAPLVTAPAAPTPLPLSTGIPGPPRREFVAPAARAGTAQPVVILEGAPSVSAEAQPASIAVVGLEPARINDIPLPEGSRSPRFSAGPDSGPGGGGRSAGIVVPGLTVQGKGSDSTVAVVTGPPIPRKAPPAYHEPSAMEWAQAVSGKDSRRLARSMMSAALRPSARVVAPIVETRFPNRSVYTTSFEVGADASMEWVVWFAEQNGGGSQYMTIRPPVPWTYAGAGPDDPPLPSGRLEVAAVIDKNGQLSSVTALNSGDEAAKQAVANLVGEWAFLPALRNGEPIAVDTLIEIRFRRRP